MFRFLSKQTVKEFLQSLSDYELAQRICDYEELLKNTLLQSDRLQNELQQMLEVMRENATDRFVFQALQERLEEEIKNGIF